MKIKKGDNIEEITLPKLDGSLFNLSETKGKKRKGVEAANAVLSILKKI